MKTNVNNIKIKPMINIKMLLRLKLLLSAMVIFIGFSGFSQAQKTDLKPSNNSFGISNDTWITYTNKANVLLEKVDEESFLNYVIFKNDGDLADRKYFVKYVNAKIKKDKEELIYKVGSGTIKKVSEVNAYLSSLQPKYTVYFADFSKNRNEIVETQNLNKGKAPIIAGTPSFNCGSPCTNPGFESGTGFWDYWSGVACATSSSDPCNLVSGFSSTAHDLTTVGGYDATVGGTTLPVVPPGGGNNAMELGDYTGTGSKASRASISFTVSAANANFTYRYAVVLQDPVSGHTDPERPYFWVKVRDSGGNVVPCGNYQVMAKPPMTGFLETSSGSDIWYTPWTTVFIPLQTYIGQCITVEFTVADCSQGGHFGYAYIDGDCDPLEILTSSPSVCGGQSVTLSAPPGGQSYAWTNTAGGTTGIVGSTTGQTAQVNQAGTYQVAITMVTGAACITNLTITIGSNPLFPVAQFTNTTACEGSATQFTDTSTPVGSINAWSWDFDADGVPDATTQNPSYTFPAAGTYPVSLIVTWGACNADTIINVTVNPVTPPTITQAGPFCSYASAVNLSGNPAGGTWSGTGITSAALGTFDPTSATVGNNVVTYSTGGVCPSSANSTIVVNDPPVSNAGADVVICTGSTATLGTTNTAGLTYSWSPATGLSSSTVSDPTYNATNATTAPILTTYIVTTTNTATTCFSSDQVDATVNPIATANAGPAQTICAGTSATLAGSIGGSATSGTWGGGAGSFNPNNSTLNAVYTPSATEEAAGSITLTLISNDPAGPCPVASSTVTITINPIATINAGPDQVICIGSTVTLAGTTGGAASSGTWSGGAGTFTPNNTTANAVYTPTSLEEAANGLTLTYSSDDPVGPCGGVSDQMIITINQLPTVNAGPPQSVCKGTAILLAGSVGGSATSGTWSGGTGTFVPSPNVLNASYTPSAAESAAGSVTLTLTTNDPPGPCVSTSSTVTFTFYQDPVVNFTSNYRQGCPVLCVQFSDLTTVGGGDNIVSWDWNFGDGSPDSTSQNPSHCYNWSGYYDVTLTTTSNHGCSTTYTILQMIHVFDVPIAAFTPTPNPATMLESTVTLNNQSSTDVNYWNWQFGDGDSIAPNIVNPEHTYPNESAGTYTATLIVRNIDGCYDTISHEVIIGPEFTFFIPNAFTPNGDGINDFFFGTGIGISVYDIYIFDRWGNMIYHGNNIDTSKWDGKANHGSEIAQQDVYVWKVKLTDVLGKKHNYIGTVTLVK